MGLGTKNKLVIAHFYPYLLNLYGDDGNVQILKYRAEKRGFEVEVWKITPDIKLTRDEFEKIDLVFMGGGPDSGQKDMYEDLLKNKGPVLKEYVERGGVGLYICGSYQLLGNYYKSADGSILNGVGIFDLYTESPGKNSPRCIGNVVCEINPDLLNNPVFSHLNKIGNTLVGFENHSGRTYLGNKMKPFAKIIKGYGNNSKDGTEGVLYKNSIGSYLHGPVLARNPHLADYLIATALSYPELKELEDNIIITAHTASKTLKQ